MKKELRFTALFGLFILGCISMPAYAYLDPGTGSMIVQAIIGMVVAVSVSLGIFWTRIKKFVRRLFKPGNKPEEDK